jgi:LacI family transcriptional regulator
MSVRSIARRLRVSPTTVSLALKNSPRVSASLRQRVAAEARATGYVPNARVTELMSEVRGSRFGGYRCTLCAFSLFPQLEPWKQPGFGQLREVFAGAKACAERHGYRLELLWLREPGMTAGRFRTILETRGVRGLYCLGSLDPDTEMPPALRSFSTVAHAASISTPLHRVVSHFAHDCTRLLEEVVERGYHRPGLVMKSSGDRRTSFAYTSTFLGFQERRFRSPHVPVLRLETWDRGDFGRWFDAHAPDVLLVHHEPSVLEGIDRFAHGRGLEVPGTLGVALLDKNPNPQRYSGVVQDNRRMGAEAIEILIWRICVNDLGPGEHPKLSLVPGSWNEGRTLRPSPLVSRTPDRSSVGDVLRGGRGAEELSGRA